MTYKEFTNKLSINAGQKIKERNFWLDRLQGEPVKTIFPYNLAGKNVNESEITSVSLRLTGPVFQQLIRISNNSDVRLYIILLTGVIGLLGKYSGSRDVLVGAPVDRQEKSTKFLNTVLILRNSLDVNASFKNTLMQVSQNFVEASQHANYPLETLLYQLDIPFSEDDDFPLFDVSVLLESIHDETYIQHINTNISILFKQTGEAVEAVFKYNATRYHESFILGLCAHFEIFLQSALFNLNSPLETIEFLTEKEKQQVLREFNVTSADFPLDKPLHLIYQEQAEKSPDRVALVYENSQVTFSALNRRANRLAHFLQDKGVNREDIVALMLERSTEMVEGMLGILKASGAYLPLNPEDPGERIRRMIDDSQPRLLLTTSNIARNYSISALQGIQNIKIAPKITANRPQIKDLDVLPCPDRSLVNYNKYNKYLDEAMVRHSISIQASRGCPYNCAYCHKIWPKSHIFRSAQHIFDEVKRYYDLGVKRFAMIDDIFNLNKKNSTEFFQLIIKNKLDINIFFPNGLRGDILTPDYIDLMVEVGTSSIAFALETASPRLQKLIGKNMKLDKLHDNVHYCCKKYPNVITELFTMLGFPNETEEEAMMTLNFIKEFKWLHFPFINLLKIFPNTDMARLAMENGVKPEDIAKSENLAFHEVPETLPFDKQFAVNYQTNFVNEYFLSKERLLSVLPHQMKILTEDEMVIKYNSYLPTPINRFEDILDLVDIDEDEFQNHEFRSEESVAVPDLHEKMAALSPRTSPAKDALRVLLLDLSQSFNHESNLLNDLVEPPIGLMYLLTYLQKHLGDGINGKVAKSMIDFDRNDQLRELIEQFKPDIIGIRTLSFYQNFFHRTVALIRQWGINVPIVTGGPYATSGFQAVLQDRNVDLVVVGEGEITFHELITAMIKNDGEMPGTDVLAKIPGLAFLPESPVPSIPSARELVLLDEPILCRDSEKNKQLDDNPVSSEEPGQLAYCIYTSGSTGIPKAVTVEHRNAVNLVYGLDQRIYSQYSGDLRVALVAPYIFDASIQQIFASLLLAHTLHVVPEDTRVNGEALLEYLIKHAVDVSDGTPSHLHLMIEHASVNGRCNIHTRHFLIGGEALPKSVVERFFNTFTRNSVNGSQVEPLKISNVYGPTECCVDSTSFEISSDNYHLLEHISIGKPMPNEHVYIIDQHFGLRPIGVAGEIHIGGAGAGRGYLNREDMTSEKFIESKFVPGERLYRTGDLARWMPDGNIQFLRRIDHQVQIRGLRIETGEIGNQLLLHKNISEAVVVVKDSFGGAKEDNDLKTDRFLCAYFVADRDVEAHELRGYLSHVLPEYMIPSFFIPLLSFPRTSSGKVDIKKLPEPQIAISQKYTPPQDEIQQKLQEIWSEILMLEPHLIGIDSDFFEMGGHSLKATILNSRIHKVFDVKVPISEMFANPTLRGNANFIRNARKKHYIAIEPAVEQTYYPLSSAQKRIYILHQLEENSLSYNAPMAVELKEQVTYEKMSAVFRLLLERHESLRTSFEMINEEPVQIIHDAGSIDFEVECLDIRAVDVKSTVKNFSRPFKLDRSPLLRAALVNIDDSRQMLLADIHHIISDGVSQDILEREFIQLYSGEVLSPLRLQYKDFAVWQNSDTQQDQIKQQETFWLRTLESPLPVLNLPYDFPRPAIQSFDGDFQFFMLDETDTRTLQDIAEQSGATLYMVLLAMINIFLSKLSGQEDIILGTPVSGRRHADLEHIIGMFVNTLPIRQFPTAGRTFREFLKEVKHRTLEAFENQDYPFETLVEKVNVRRDTSRNPIFDVMYSYNHMNLDFARKMRKQLEESGEVEGIMDRVAKFDLSIDVSVDYQVMILFEYCTQLFSPDSIQRFMKYFRLIINSVLNDADREMYSIDIMDDDKRQILMEFNNDQIVYSDDYRLHQMFERQVERTPDADALIFDGRYWSYAQLNEAANRQAHYLKSRGVKPDSIVGLYSQPSAAMITAILAILKADGAYLPLNPELPQNRLQHMIDDAMPVCVAITHELPADITIDAPLANLVQLEESGGLPGRTSNPEGDGQPGNLAYVIYTSGSSGEPKGVMVEHKNVTSYVNVLLKEYQVTGEDVALQSTSYSFDLFVNEMYPVLSVGGALAVAGRETVLDVDFLVRFIEDTGVTIVVCSPLLLNSISRRRGGQGVRLFASAGDVLKPEYVAQLPAAAQVYNAYGPTETTVVATHYKLTGQEQGGRVPIGKPLDNYNAYILDKYDHLLPVGIPGELCIRGTGTVRGYLNQAALTAQKFTTYHSSFTGSRSLIYKTGDLARWLPDGNIEFLGRIDQQIQIRGFRVEPGEIEYHLLKHPQVKETVVTAGEDRDGDKFLCAYIVPGNSEEAPTGLELHHYMSDFLPGYMIPSHVVILEYIPVTLHGKVDYTSLPAPRLDLDREFTPPRTEIETAMAEIWADVLNIEPVTSRETSYIPLGIDDNFFQLGGHSLKATVLMSRVHKVFNVKLPLAALFKAPSIRELAAVIKRFSICRFYAIEKAEEKEYYPLSAAQSRFFTIWQMNPESTAYNVPQTMVLGEPPEPEQLQSVFNRLIERHAGLRTSFTLIHNQAVQKIHPRVDFEMEFYEVDDQGGANQVIRSFIRPFDLTHPPLIRAGLLTVGDGRRILMVDMHHIITDGISIKILIDEFTQLNRGEELASLPLQYVDYSQWQNSPRQQAEIARQEAFWLKKFESKVESLNLPTDFPRKAERDFSGGHQYYELSKEQADVVKRMASSEGTTIYFVLLAVYFTWLSRLTGQEDLVIGTAVAGRGHNDLMNIIGLFFNTLVLRENPLDDIRFKDFLAEVMAHTLDVFENPDYPFDRLIQKLSELEVIQRAPGRNPLFDTMFAHIKEDEDQEPEEAGAGSGDNGEKDNSIAKFDLLLNVVERPRSIFLVMEYSATLFKKETIEKWLGYYVEVLTQVMENPESLLGDIEITSSTRDVKEEFRDSDYAEFNI